MTQVGPFFAEMEQYISDSRAAVAEGKEFELTALDEKIGRLCDMVLALSPEEQSLYEGRLEELLGGLNALGLELKSQHEDTKNIPMHRQANVAYRTADSRDNFGIRDEDE